MKIQSILPVVILLLPIGSYFLIRGIRSLVTKRMSVSNPHAYSPPTSVMGVVVNVMKNKVKSDYPVPELFVSKEAKVQVKGAELIFRALLNILFGVLIFGVIALFVFIKMQ